MGLILSPHAHAGRADLRPGVDGNDEDHGDRDDDDTKGNGMYLSKLLQAGQGGRYYRPIIDHL